LGCPQQLKSVLSRCHLDQTNREEINMSVKCMYVLADGKLWTNNTKECNYTCDVTRLVADVINCVRKIPNSDN